MPYHQSTMPNINATALGNTPANQVEVSNPENCILHGWRVGSESADQGIPMEDVASSQPPPTTPHEEEDEDEDDDIDADGLPSVQSCIDVIFTIIDGLPVKRICQLCRLVIVTMHMTVVLHVVTGCASRRARRRKMLSPTSSPVKTSCLPIV
jgi:hypothetical protein